MPETVPAEAQVMQMITAQFVSRLVYLIALLKIPDFLDEGPKTAEELALLTKTDARSLYRVLRSVSSLGFFKRNAAGQFSLQPLGETLRSGTPVYAAALVMGGELTAHSLDNLLYSVETGKTGFEKAMGMPTFEWLAGHPEEAALFNRTMIGFHGMEPPAVAAAYDFSAFRTIADVGGSTGNMLCTILGQHVGPRGILFDLPHVTEAAPALIEQKGLTDRIRIEPGSFFETVPAGADAYLLSHVIHDWSEEECLTILGNCHRAIGTAGRLLLVEMVLPEDDTPHPGKMLDMVMLSMSGGQERTASEYGTLLEKAGFRMTRVIPTASPVSVVEAVPR